MRVIFGVCIFYLARWLDSLLPPVVFYRLYYPFVVIGLLFRPGARKKRNPPVFPELVIPDSLNGEWRKIFQLSVPVEALHERLGESKWMERCHFEGLEHLDKARNEGRPVVLVFFHCGPFRLIRPWLRARGYPVAAVVGAKRDRPSLDKTIRDRYTPLPGVPIRFYVEQIWPLNRFLSRGGQLLIALDGFAGEQIRFEIEEGWTFRIATGPMRLAALHQADLIPCSIADEGRWCFRLSLGAPVPLNQLSTETDYPRVARYLVREILNQMSDHPDQFGPGYSSRFNKVETGDEAGSDYSNSGDPSTE